MITNDEIGIIINKIETSDVEQLEVIRRYIYDIKHIDIGKINRPKNLFNIQLMSIAYEKACEYYFNL